MGVVGGLHPPTTPLSSFDYGKIQRAYVIIKLSGDDRLRRERLAPDCEPRGAEIVKSAQNTSANRTAYAALPLAA